MHLTKQAQCPAASPPLALLCRNEPNVHRVERLPNSDEWHGSTLAVTIQGSLQTGYRAKILRYLQQIAVITPYACFNFEFKSEDGKGDLKYEFQRRTDKMPSPPQVSSGLQRSDGFLAS